MKPMTELHRRLIIALDEWGGILTLLYLAPPEWHQRMFFAFLPAWFIAVYVISYPLLWRAQSKSP